MGRRKLLLGLAFILVSVLALLPLGFVKIPPMVDYPNHLLRCAILAELPHDQTLQAMYEPRDELLPNLAMDAVVVPLARVLPIETAGKVFCGLTLFMMFSGAFLLAAAVAGRATWWGLAPALLLFNHIFTFGFLNYLFGIGLMLWGLAAWIWMSRTKKPAPWLVGVATFFAILLFLSHLIAMALFGVAVAAYEIGVWWESGRSWKDFASRAMRVAAVFILPLLLLKVSPTSGEVAAYYPSSLGDKVDSVVSLLRVVANRTDQLFSLVVLVCVVALYKSGSLRINRPMLFSVLGVTAAFLLLPSAFASCACVDLRVPIAMAFLLVGGSHLVSLKGWLPQTAVALLAVAFLGRTLQVSRDWIQAERTTNQVLADMGTLPDHSVVFTACDDQTHLFSELGWSPPLIHLPLAEGLHRPMFFPQLFALARQHPLEIKPALQNLEFFEGIDPFDFNDGEQLGRILQDCRQEVGDPKQVPAKILETPSFYLFAILRPGKQHEVDKYPGVRLLVRRPRYAIFKLTPEPDTEAAMLHSHGRVTHPVPHHFQLH